MKCPNCGGEVSVNEIKCSYCGTPNPKGIAFQTEVHKRKRFNEYLREKIAKQMELPLRLRVLNLSLVVMSLILVILLVIHLILFLFMENAFESEPEETASETQMSILQYDYDSFLYHSMSCMEALEQGMIPDDYHLEYTIVDAQKLLCPDILAYPEIYPENQEQLADWQEEVYIYLTGILRFTDADMQSLYPSDEYDWFSYDEQEALTTEVIRKLKEAGYHEEID